MAAVQSIRREKKSEKSIEYRPVDGLFNFIVFTMPKLEAIRISISE